MSEDKNIRRDIDYLLGIDPVEHWPKNLGFSPSGEDYGNTCVWNLSNSEPTEEIMAALVHGALRHHDERVRFSCAEGVARIDPKLAKILYYIQTLDAEDYTRENALEALWHADNANLELARRATDRLLKDPDQFVRDTAKSYKKSDEVEPILYEGSHGGKYIIDNDGEKQYIK